MTATHLTPRVDVTDAPLAALDADLVIVPIFEGGDIADLSGLDAATRGELGRALRAGELKGKRYEQLVTPVVDDGWRAARVALVGAGPAASFDVDRLRRVATAAGLLARQRRAERVAFRVRGRVEAAAASQAIVEGLTLANFDAARYKTSEHDDAGMIGAVQVSVERGAAACAEATRRGRILGECSNLARTLANEPGNLLPPRVFAEEGARVAREGGVGVEILDERRIGELKMGFLLGVARGSAEPPRVIVMRHEPKGVGGPVLGLVGKGITFDTGGISIKPAEGMERMKDDMAGGAAVICAMRAIGLLQAPARVIGVVPATENMPGSRAIKPGDILTGASGKTVEVLNTDAEGRLILGDGLWYARELGATHLIDIATLTGACVIALGKITSGLFGTPPEFVNLVRETADQAGDRAWPMPVFDEYFDQLKSDIADMTNTGGRPGGAITAAVFLKQFTGDLPWVHMDIAGTAWNEEARPYLPKGASGVGVRTLAEMAFTSVRWP